MTNSIRIVLVEPSHPGNIGGAARAMKTMGLADLALVNPKRYPDPQAEWRAAQAIDILDAARVCASIDEAIGDCGLVVGTSARQRSIPWPVVAADELADRLAAEPDDDKPTAILFGREASGLTNEELQRCQLHLVIPANPEYSSLNLAMAVQVVCYEIHKARTRTDAAAHHDAEWDRPAATVAALESFYAHLELVLRAIDFYNPKAPRQAMTRLRRLFGRVRPDETEIAMLRGILTHIERAAGIGLRSSRARSGSDGGEDDKTKSSR